MTTAHIITLLVTGAGVGFAGGLVGVGGAFIMTPIRYLVLTGKSNRLFYSLIEKVAQVIGII